MQNQYTWKISITVFSILKQNQYRTYSKTDLLPIRPFRNDQIHLKGLPVSLTVTSAIFNQQGEYYEVILQQEKTEENDEIFIYDWSPSETDLRMLRKAGFRSVQSVSSSKKNVSRSLAQKRNGSGSHPFLNGDSRRTGLPSVKRE